MGTSEKMSFGIALDRLKELGKSAFMTRSNWYGSEASPKVFLQRPDEDSKMTEPYLYMEKNPPTMSGGLKIRFPLDLSCESILSEDWVLFPEG